MMYVAISPSKVVANGWPQTPAQVLQGMRGRASMTFARSGDETRLKDLYQSSPLRALFPGKASGDVLSAALVTTSGGLLGGDHLDVEVKLEAAAAVQVIGQAAEKVYRSKGPDTIFDVRLEVAEDAWLEWLPQETILFDQARLRRHTCVDVAAGGAFLGAEMLVFGRAAMGETLRTGLIRDVWEVRRGAKLIWADALHLAGDLSVQLDHPAGFGGARAAATAVYVADDAAAHLAFVREVLDGAPDGVRCAATVVNGVLVVRWLAFDAQALRGAFGVYWAAMRHEVKGLPGLMPRLWQM
ncbi:MAG: urease accessory protein UreD [Rhodospirillales bacterium]|nr:urease accessory protein UreD [Rhodospirillales bacterium]